VHASDILVLKIIIVLVFYVRQSAMLKHVLAVPILSVRPSVRHTLVLYQNEYCHAFFTTE